MAVRLPKCFYPQALSMMKDQYRAIPGLENGFEKKRSFF